MLHERQSTSPVSELITRLQEAATADGLAVVGIVPIREEATREGVPDDDRCILLELSSPAQGPCAADNGRSVATLLPFRVSVSSKNGLATVGLVRSIVLSSYPDVDDVRWTSEEDTEHALIHLIDTACDAVRQSVA
jgi:uncharacterized protein (DUF302 family)